jgi:acetyl-CoA/propionyl-CoA carboxylase biotin carboxyl carrier protein
VAEVRAVGGGWYVVRDGERQTRVAIASDANVTWIHADGIVTTLQARTERPTRGRRGDDAVSSPMPATVVAINTAPGRSVNEGDTVIVLEAMKMELPIKAPRSGVVKAVNCAKGELVQPGVTLLELE